MPDRFLRIALGLTIGLLIAFVAQPYVMAFLYSADTPRPIEARGDLSSSEKTTVDLFAEPRLPSFTSSRNPRPRDGR